MKERTNNVDDNLPEIFFFSDKNGWYNVPKTGTTMFEMGPTYNGERERERFSRMMKCVV